MSKLTPIKIFMIYWILCLILYACGPFAWVTFQPILFWGLNISFLVAFYFGWEIGKKKKRNFFCKWNEYDENDIYILRILHIKIVINFIYELVNLFRTFLFDSFDIYALIIRLINGISNMGESYNYFQENINISSVQVIGGKVVTIFNYIWEFWAFSTFLLSILYFKKLKFLHKILTIMTLGIIVVAYVARGTNIGVFRIVLALLVFYYIKCVKKSVEKNIEKRFNTIKFLILGIIGIIVVVVLFDKIMKSRGGILLWQTDDYNIGGIGINKESIFFKILPQEYYALLVALTGYLSQGFYGMSLTLRVPWRPTFGLGSSMMLQQMFSNFFPNLSSLTYQYRIEKFGWDSYVQWHTMYSWLANDVSYFGVVLIMAIIGFLFEKVYSDCVEDNNPYAYLLLYYLFLMAVFLPCNNQLFQSSYVMFSFFQVFLMWIITRNGKVIKIGECFRL